MTCSLKAPTFREGTLIREVFCLEVMHVYTCMCSVPDQTSDRCVHTVTSA